MLFYRIKFNQAFKSILNNVKLKFANVNFIYIFGEQITKNLL